MADNVTPRIGVKLAESEPGTGFSTLDVINGLHGVCVALDTCVVTNGDTSDNAQYLVQAAKVLSRIIQDRWAG